METKPSRLEHIEAIIHSCTTLDQLETCFSFTNYIPFRIPPDQKQEIIGMMRQKLHEFRIYEHQKHIALLKAFQYAKH